MAKTESVEQLDPTEGLTLDIVKKRAIAGVLALTGRTALMQVISFGATILLTLFLSPAQYGIFFLVSAVVNFFAYFSDVGLAAALVQKKEAATDEELKTTFTVQQSLVLSLVLLIFLATPLFQRWHGLSHEGIYLLWALAISLFFSSLKTIPSVLLERKLDFNKLIIPQIVETLLFNVVAVFLAWKGFGITSFTVAVLVRGLSGLILMYILQPWAPGLSFSKKSLASLLKFGLPYQANTFLAVLKDDGMTMILGGILGPAGIGLLGWAQKWGYAPLRFFMDQVIKVTFPAFSRLQDNKQELSSAVSRSIFFVCLLVFPSLVGLTLLAPTLTLIIPKYEKWSPALLALGIFGINAAIAAITTPLTNMLNAIGKIKTTFKLMIMWTALTWIFVPVLALKFGVNGAALGTLLVGLSSVIAIYIAYKTVNFDFIYSIAKPLIASITLAVVIKVLQVFVARDFTGVILIVICGLITYIVTIFALIGPSLATDTRKAFHAILKR